MGTMKNKVTQLRPSPKLSDALTWEFDRGVVDDVILYRQTSNPAYSELTTVTLTIVLGFGQPVNYGMIVGVAAQLFRDGDEAEALCYAEVGPTEDGCLTLTFVSFDDPLTGCTQKFCWHAVDDDVERDSLTAGQF